MCVCVCVCVCVCICICMYMYSLPVASGGLGISYELVLLDKTTGSFLIPHG